MGVQRSCLGNSVMSLNGSLASGQHSVRHATRGRVAKALSQYAVQSRISHCELRFCVALND